MIQDIEPQRLNNQYSNRREPEDHDMVLSFSEKMIFAKVMDDENLLGFMTYGELQKITGCDRKIGDLVYLFSILCGMEITDLLPRAMNTEACIRQGLAIRRLRFLRRRQAGICRFGTGPTGSVVPVERELFMMRKRGCSDVRHAAG